MCALVNAKGARELGLSSVVRVNEVAVFRSLGAEGVLFKVDTAEYFGLDPVGSRIWFLLEQSRSLRDVLQELCKEYDCSEQQCREDLLGFVGRLVENGLVSVDVQPDDTKSSA